MANSGEKLLPEQVVMIIACQHPVALFVTAEENCNKEIAILALYQHSGESE